MSASDYVCTLDAETVAKAKEELGEDPKERDSAVRTLREWVLSQKHLSLATDCLTLLAYLRGNKFSQLMAREMIVKYLKAKTRFPQWLDDVDPQDSVVQRLLSRGYILKLPKRDKEGRTIILYRVGELDPSKRNYTFSDIVHSDMILLMCAVYDEYTMVNGTVLLVDFTGIGLKHIPTSDFANLGKWAQCWEGHFPGRFKEMHYYNCGAVFEALMAAVRPFLSKKMQDRIKTHSNLESVYKHLPMEYLPEEYLPDEYEGPNQGNLDTITKNFMVGINQPALRQRLLEFTHKRHKYDESKVTKEVQSSFRKLNVD